MGKDSKSKTDKGSDVLRVTFPVTGSILMGKF